MPDSLFATLLQSLDRHSISAIATFLGHSDQSIPYALGSTVATVLGRVANKCEDLGGLRKLLELFPSDLGEFSWSRLSGNISNPNPLLIGAGNRILSNLFGASQNSVTDALSEECGLTPGAAKTLLTLVSPMVIGFLGKRVHDEGLSMRALANLLHNECPTIRKVLPPSLSGFLCSPFPARIAPSPVIAQSIRPEPRLSHWVLPISVFAAALGCFWLLSHSRRGASEVASVAVTGSASRLTPEAAGLTNQREPGFHFGNLLFNSGSAELPPRAHEQLERVTRVLRAFPNVHLKIEGYTDNLGNAAQNLALSRARADAVKAALVAQGISPDRLETEGFGNRGPISDNSTEHGRARNRRATLQALQE